MLKGLPRGFGIGFLLSTLFAFGAFAQNSDSSKTEILKKIKDPKKPWLYVTSDRPGAGISASLVKKDTWNLEAGNFYQNFGNGLEASLQPEALVRYGIYDWMELRLSTSLARVETVRGEIFTFGESNESFFITRTETLEGFTPLVLGAKVRVLKETESKPAVALIPSISSGSFASSDFDDDKFAFGLRAVVEKTFEEVHNLSFNVEGASQSDLAVWFYSGAYSLRFSRKWGGFVEFFGTKIETQPFANTFDFGFNCVAAKGMQFDISVGFGLNDYAPKSFFSFGFTRNL